MKKYLYCLVLLLFCGILFCGCGQKAHKQEMYEGFQMYYINKDEDKLITVPYELKEDNKDSQVEEVIRQMRKVSSKINCVNAVPEDVNLIGYTVDDNTVNMNFSVEYQNMNKSREILCRAANVLTLTQIDGIDYVVISVVGEPLKNSEGNEIEPLKAADFVDISGYMINNYQEIELTLYFASVDGNKLVEDKVIGVFDENKSMERYVLDNLIKGSADAGKLRTVPENTKIISVTTKDGICYVNLDSSFLTEAVEVSDEIEVYSIVNSLCELTNVNKVQFSFNGETDKKLHNNTKLSGMFTRNLDILAQTN